MQRQPSMHNEYGILRLGGGVSRLGICRVADASGGFVEVRAGHVTAQEGLVVYIDRGVLHSRR